MAKKSYVYKKTAFVRRGVKAQDAGEELHLLLLLMKQDLKSLLFTKSLSGMIMWQQKVIVNIKQDN
jgi:hypothetical protein